jgi:phage terminase large subunit-like protein
MTKLYDSAVVYDYTSFVQMGHKLLRNELLDNDPYVEHCCHIASEFAAGNRTRVIVNMPPGFAKTTIFSICMIAWLFAHDPRLRIMVVAHDAALAREILAAVRKIMKSEEYRRIYDTRIAKGYDTTENLQTTQGGRLFACSIEGGITGRRVDVVIVDDALAIKHAGKLSRVQKVNHNFDKEIVTRLADPTNGRIIIVMHRLHKEDLTAHLMKQRGWDLIVHPLIAVRSREYRFGGLIWCRKKGDQLRAGLYTKKRLRELMEEDGAPSSRHLYQQGTGPDTNFNLIAKHFPLVDTRQLPKDLPVVFSIDTSQKEGPDCSRNVILVMVRFGSIDIVLDEFCARTDYMGLYRAFQELAADFHPSAVIIEHASNGSALISQLQDEAIFQIIPVNPNGTKSKRLRPHLGRIRRGHVRLPKGAEWFGAFVGEFEDFPDGGSDRVDALTMYLDFMKSNPVLGAPRRRERGLAAAVGSRGPFRLRSSPPQMQTRGAVLVTASSLLGGCSTPMERRSPAEEITVIMGTADGIIRKKI